MKHIEKLKKKKKKMRRGENSSEGEMMKKN